MIHIIMNDLRFQRTRIFNGSAVFNLPKKKYRIQILSFCEWPDAFCRDYTSRSDCSYCTFSALTACNRQRTLDFFFCWNCRSNIKK